MLIDYLVEELPVDQWTITHGHPTLSLIHFFNDMMRTNVLLDSVPCMRDIWFPQFVRNLFRVLVLRITESEMLIGEYPSLPVAWSCPCGDTSSCGLLCRVLKDRLSILKAAAEIVASRGKPRLLNHVYAHIDSHMPLMCAISSYDMFLGGNGTSPRTGHACEDRYMIELIEHAPPSLMWAYTEECVPDTSQLLLLSVYYNDRSKVMSNKRVIQCKFPHLNEANIIRIQKLVNLLYKGLPNRCNNRELWNFIRRCCVNVRTKARKKNSMSKNGDARDDGDGTSIDVDMIEFFMKLIIASLLGVYSTSALKMTDIGLRQNMYSLFYSPVKIRQVLDIMVPSNKITLLYITKEYIRCMAHRNTGVMEGLRSMYEWDSYNTFINGISDIIRRSVQDNMKRMAMYIRSLGDIFRGVDIFITSLHSESRRTQHQSTVNYDVPNIYKALCDINLKEYAHDQNDGFDGDFSFMKTPHPTLSKEAVKTMQEVIATYNVDQWIPLRWLACFGAAVHHTYFVQNALFHKMTVLTKYMAEMKHSDPASYAVFFTFFRLAKLHKEHRVYTADAFMYLQHAHALNTHHGIGKGMHIPKVLGKVLVCPNCNDFKRPSFFSPLRRNKNGGGVGIVRACSDGRIVCGVRAKVDHRGRSKTRKTSPSREDDYENEDDEDAGVDDDLDMFGDPTDAISRQSAPPRALTKLRNRAKHVAHYHTLNECRTTELVMIDTLGKVTEYQGQEYISCMKCIRTIPLAMAIDRGMFKLCVSCYAIDTAGETEKPKCEAPGCSKRLLTASDYRCVYVYDDVADLPLRRFRHMMLCTYHSSAHVIHSSTMVHNASDVYKYIYESKNSKKTRID